MVHGSSHHEQRASFIKLGVVAARCDHAALLHGSYAAQSHRAASRRALASFARHFAWLRDETSQARCCVTHRRSPRDSGTDSETESEVARPLSGEGGGGRDHINPRHFFTAHFFTAHRVLNCKRHNHFPSPTPRHRDSYPPNKTNPKYPTLTQSFKLSYNIFTVTR